MKTALVLNVILSPLLVLAVAQPVAAQDQDESADRVRKLEEMVRRLAERVADLEARLDQQARQPIDQEMPNVSQGGLDARLAKLEERANKYPNPMQIYWKDGIRIDSDDGLFKLRIGGRIQLDGAIMDADNGLERRGIGDLEDSLEFRRARIYIQGDIYEDYFFRVQYDFAGGDAEFRDVYMGMRNLPYVGNIMVGQFKEPFGLEELTSSNYITFMERSTGTEAFAPARNTGLMLYNTAFNKRMTWAAGVFLETDDFGDGEFNDGFNYTARLTGLPWYEEDGRELLHLGVAFSHKNFEGDRRVGDSFGRFRSRPESHLAPRFVDTGRFFLESANLLGVEAAWVHGPFSLQGEYVHVFANGLDAFRSSNPDFNAFYTQASYFLTGEHRKYKQASGTFTRVRPLKNFRDDGGRGAWEVAARYSYIDLDRANINGDRLDDFTLGLNWYLNPNMRVMFNYILADSEDRGDANIFQMRFQVDF
ncbi:MAG: porin [Planctomycetes bacterium]|nr:porin [Planctomycetota bacterium]